MSYFGSPTPMQAPGMAPSPQALMTPPFGSAQPGLMGAPNIQALIQQAMMARQAMGGGAPMQQMQPPQQPGMGMQPGMFGGGAMSPQLLQMMMQRQGQTQGNPMMGQIANGMGLAGSGAPYGGGLYGGAVGAPNVAAQGMGFYPGF